MSSRAPEQSFGYGSMAKLLPFGLLVFAVFAVPLRILSEEGLPRYRKLSAQLTRIQADNVALNKSIKQLSEDVEGLRSDPRAVERIARDELGLLREGEVLFQFAPVEGVNLTAGQR
ncbi:MAG: septum formation initiator family protein [Myxococcales bacterium]